MNRERLFYLGIGMSMGSMTVSSFSLPAQAQIPFSACIDRQGAVIPGVVDNTMEWAGVATEREGKPVILWNKRGNQRLSTTEQIFIYLHECAHHTLGHIHRQPYTPAVELEADCWAIQLMVDGGMIKGRHLEDLEKSRRTVKGDTYHLGGEAHIQSLQRCLDVRTDAKAWAAALNAFVQGAQDSFTTQRGGMLDSTSADRVYESLLGAPGTYDCEVIGAAVRCLVFAARKEGASKERFERLVRIVRAWLPVGWTSVERSEPGRLGRSFLAQDGMTGTLLSLTQAGSVVYFLMKRAPV
ncbi:MAG: hypothetical protein QOH59_1528 [Gemmatimonadales bacterium]|jgi:hypothetical protein|nr:hypothetical protein [Gemmatimonadales bacterium]